MHILAAFLLLLAADVTGKWTGDLQTPRGMAKVTYTLKQTGETLTGTMQAGQSPDLTINNGKVTGDKLTFIVDAGGTDIAHEGAVSGDEIKLEMKPAGEFPGATLTVKRVKE